MLKTNLKAANAEFAEWVKEGLETHGITSVRQAELRTYGKVSYSAFHDMLAGRVPTESTIIKFATSFGVNVAKGLRIAGYDDLANIWDANTGGKSSKLLLEGEDEEEVIIGYRQARNGFKKAFLALARSVKEETPTYGAKTE